MAQIHKAWHLRAADLKIIVVTTSSAVEAAALMQGLDLTAIVP